MGQKYKVGIDLQPSEHPAFISERSLYFAGLPPTCATTKHHQGEPLQTTTSTLFGTIIFLVVTCNDGPQCWSMVVVPGGIRCGGLWWWSAVAVNGRGLQWWSMEVFCRGGLHWWSLIVIPGGGLKLWFAVVVRGVGLQCWSAVLVCGVGQQW